MRWAYVADSQFVRFIQIDGYIPTSVGHRRKLRSTLVALAEASDTDTLTLLRGLGIYPVSDNAKPADTETTTHDESYVVVGDEVVQTWTERNKTQGELDSDAAAARRAGLLAVLASPTEIQTLRDWAADAESTTVTSGNAVNVLNVMLDRFAVFFDRFADKLELDS